MLSLHRLQRKQKQYSNSFRICIFLFLSLLIAIETINTFTHSVVSSKTIPDTRPKWAKFIPVFRPKRRKNLPERAAHTMAYIREYPPPVAWVQTSPISTKEIGDIKRDINLTLGLLPPPPPSPRRHVVWRDSAGVGSSRSGLKSECPDIFHQSSLWLLRHTEVPTRVACSRLRDSSESEKSFKNKYSCLWLQSCSVLSSFGVDVLWS